MQPWRQTGRERTEPINKLEAKDKIEQTRETEQNRTNSRHM